MPEVVVKAEGDRVDISFIPLDDYDVVSTIGSSIVRQQLSYNLGNWKLSNIVHDFTFFEYIEKTDAKLTTIFKKSGTEITKYTPDYVVEKDNYNIIVEVGTNQGNQGSIRHSYSDKRQKYENVLRSILQSEKLMDGNSKQILFGIIIVGHQHVHSNLELEPAQIQELQMRFKVGLKIQKELAEMGVINVVQRDATEMQKQLEQYFLKLDKLSEPEVELWNKSIQKRIELKDDDSEFLKAHLARWDEARIDAYLSSPRTDLSSKKTAEILKSSLVQTVESATNYTQHAEERRKKSEDAHLSFEEEYLRQNEGNMKTVSKAMVNCPLIVMRPTIPSRVPSRGIELSDAKFETVYDVLYYAGMVKAAGDPEYFPDYEADILEQYGWEARAPETFMELLQMKENNMSKIFTFTETFNLQGVADEFLSTALSVIEKDVEKQRELSASFKGKTARFSAALTSTDRFELALKGVQGKGLTERVIKGRINPNYDDEVFQTREGIPDWFHIQDTDTSDLDQLMNDVEFYKDLIEETYSSAESTLLWRSLITQSRSLHGDNFLKPLEEEQIEWLSKTKLFLWGKLITDIGTEIDISLKQNCKKDEFVFKKVQDFDVWLLIKPTKKSEQIFCSILFKTDSILYHKQSTVFKRVNKLFGGNNFVYTNFISLTESKILNWVIFLPRLLGLFRFWVNFSGIEPYTERRIINEPEPSQAFTGFFKNSLPMLMLTLIIGLSDKTEVEEEITRTRYLVMESLSEWPIEPKPYKMVDKVSMNIRSRLTLWLYRRHKELCHSYSANPPSAKNEEVYGQGHTETSNQLFWDGFINPYTGFKLSSGQQVINLFYLGYIKNKDEVAQANKSSKLYDKILTYELQYDLETANILGLESPQQPRPHCFDLDLLLDSAIHLKARIRQSYPEFDYTFMKNMHGFLFLRSVEEDFSTLKASSNFDESLFDRKRVNVKYQRARVIEKLALEGEGAVTVSELFERKYISSLKSRGLNIDIFRKPQHGGDREIYVLGFKERVVQKLIEQIARFLCEFIPEETMTHPGNKVTIPENNGREAKTRFKMGHITLNSSADASKWSQNNSSFKMLICLLVLTPSYLHKTIIRCLRLWEFKRILINPKILELFDQHRDLLLHDKTLQKMFNGYKGYERIRWIGPGDPYIKVTTGMMQGILHYTSSLYHSAVISRVKEVVAQNCKAIQQLLSYQTNFKLIMCHLQSSDDSYFSVSAPLNGEIDFARKSRILATAILQFKVDYSSHCGVVNSIKSVLNSNHVFEFNSNFEFGFNHYKPDIKAVLSGFLVSEQELLLSRQEELSVLLTTYIENGGTNYVANGLQIGQSYLHYHLLGLNTTRYFRSYEALQTILPDPSVGYFLMDNPLCPGLLGFKYSLWNAVKSTNLGKLYKHKLRPLVLANDKLEESVKLSIELSAHGSLSASYKLLHGNRLKWLRLLTKMQVDENWKEKISESPEVLFRRSMSVEEVGIKISQKMHSPGVSASLSSLNTLPRILAESAYILKLQAVTSLSNWIDPKKTDLAKVTLIEAIIKEMKEVVDDEEINEQELRILFPFHDDFTRNQQLLSGVHVVQIGQSFREYKRKETSIEIATNNEYNLVSLKGILLSFWFENNLDINTPNLSREHRSYIFEQHQKVIPWIRKDINESLRNSPFNEMVEMLLWLNTFSGRRRVVRLLGTQIISRHGHSRLLSVVVNNLSSSHRLNLDRVNIENPISLVSSVRSEMILIATLPVSIEQKSRLMRELFSKAGDKVTYMEGVSRSKQNDIILMCKIARVSGRGWSEANAGEVLMIINEMRKNKHGTLGFFTQRQKCITNDSGVSYYGDGTWEGMIDGFDIKIRIGNKIGEPVTVKSITVNTPLATIESVSLRRFIIQMRWQIPSRVHIVANSLFLNDKGLNTNSGAPVNLDINYNVNITDYYKLKPLIEWTGRNLRCVSQYKCGAPITILSISPKIQHYDPSSNFANEAKYKTFETTWLNNTTLTGPAAAKLVTRYNRLDEDRKELIKTNLKSKLQSQGIVFKRKMDLIDLAFISKEDEFDFDIMNELNQMGAAIDLNDITDFKINEVTNSPEINDLEDFDEQNVDEDTIGLLSSFDDKISPMEIIQKEVWRSHPLFRDFAQSVIQEVGRDLINQLINKREYTVDLIGYLEVFEVLLGESRESWTLKRPRSLRDLMADDGSDISDNEGYE
ncbi:RNA-dependent RNA polymerase [Guadeloupe mosquito phasivirus]|uniref:RNA-directed RNA polymerase L n=1 Tax=Guadeloupe mosquito phasivirus TaxID=2607734 RepID=A0A5C1K457_9VIRU|nr:RNA-dependent RNA polymerase [Guadeloupe mosquito phasivirus]QEM39249.1 RNA-dependent RNA polymerase [Guadeloupe mosquito phasivirus]